MKHGTDQRRDSRAVTGHGFTDTLICLPNIIGLIRVSSLALFLLILITLRLSGATSLD
jgi:hypothetical protein